jgi:hypothetical protein
MLKVLLVKILEKILYIGEICKEKIGDGMRRSGEDIWAIDQIIKVI